MAVTGNDLGDFVDYDKAFDPTDINQWQGQNTQRTKLQILDDIYHATEKKILNGIKQQRIENMKGRQRQKTLMMEKMELIEEKVHKRFELDMSTKVQDVVDLQKKEFAGQKDKINYEKMRGRFKVTINKNLDMKKRIQSFSNDPVIYYLHKNRNFIRKLEPVREHQSIGEKVEELAGNLDEMFYNQRRDMHYASMGISPKNKNAVAMAPPFVERKEILSSRADQQSLYSIQPLIIAEQQKRAVVTSAAAAVSIVKKKNATPPLSTRQSHYTKGSNLVDDQSSKQDIRIRDNDGLSSNGGGSDANQKTKTAGKEEKSSNLLNYDSSQDLTLISEQRKLELNSQEKSQINPPHTGNNIEDNNEAEQKLDNLQVTLTKNQNLSQDNLILPEIIDSGSFQMKQNNINGSQKRTSDLNVISRSHTRQNVDGKSQVEQLLELAQSEGDRSINFELGNSIEQQNFLNSPLIGPRSMRNASTIDPSNRSILSSRRHQASKASQGALSRKHSHKNDHSDQEKFRYNMIYNKMHHMLNDQSQKKKRQVMGSRNLNTQAKLMITQPSYTDFTMDGDQSPNNSSSRRFKVSLPILSPQPTSHKESFMHQASDVHMFEVQPPQKPSNLGHATNNEDLDTVVKRKGKVTFSSNSMVHVPKIEGDADEDVQLKFRQDQRLLRSLLKSCKGEEQDSKYSLKALKEMLSEANIAQSRFDMVFSILDELEGVDARAIEQLFFYKINGLQEFEQEAKEVTRFHKFSQLESTGSMAKMQLQQDAIRRKQLLEKLKQRKAKQ